MAFADYTLKAYTENSKAMFDYWISFFPTAPMFGVEWRFGEAFTPGWKWTAERAEIGTPAQETNADKASVDADESVVIEPAAVVVAAPEVVETVEAETFEDTEVADNGVAALLYSEPPAEIDDLKALKGVGPSLEAQLNNLGVYKFEQLANFDRDQLEWLDENLNTVKGRCIRDDWSGQAKSMLI